MEHNNSNKNVKEKRNTLHLIDGRYTGFVIDKLYLDEDKENLLLELEDHVRDMTPDYLRKEKLLY